MAQQDKTDWYWNGVLAGAVNNLYYDFINVDVVHVPYTTTHRNSSFFLQTRRSYTTADKRDKVVDEEHKDWDVVDVKYVRNDTCSKSSWKVFVLLANKARTKIRIHSADIEDWCVQNFDWHRTRREFTANWCWAFKLFSTDYVKGKRKTPWDIKMETWMWTPEPYDNPYTGWIQINKYEWWTTHWYFSDVNVENWTEKFIWLWEDEDNPEHWFKPWDYILVYKSREWADDWFAWQVRMITWVEWWRLTVDAPWQWFKVLDSDSEEEEILWKWVSYAIFPDRWEVIWFTQWRNIYIVNYADWDELERQEVYDQSGLTYTNIISVAEAMWKIYVLTDNWYIHFSNYSGYDKFFIQDDMFAGTDKNVITSYRDIIIAFWNKNISVWVPDENNTYSSMYSQSGTVWLRSRYSFTEYDWDLLFISNDRRLLALWIAANAWKYMLQYEDVGDMINSKLTVLTSWDEVFLWNDNNDLRVFIQTKSIPYYNDDWDWQAKLTWLWYSYDNNWDKEENKYQQENTMSRIIKFDKQFKVRTEDWVQWILLQWVELWVYYWENWLYQRGRWSKDYKWDRSWLNNSWHSYWFKSYISAYLMENETDWVWWTNSRLANRPKLYNLSKLNRLITTLWPWVYTHDSKIRITSYIKWLWSVYEFSIDWWNNDWLWLITTKYLWLPFSEEDEKKIECMRAVLQDNKELYQSKCTWTPNAAIQNLAQQQPWCDNYDELIVFDRWVCIDDSLYEFAPTMPLATDLWENQDYATQIKLELIWWVGDIITFGGWLWEMFIAPLFTKWPDWEYQLKPNTDC